MSPYYEHGGITIYCGNAADVVPALEGDLGLLTDPPYGLGWGRHEKRAGNGVKCHQTGFLAGKALPSRDYGTSTWDDCVVDGALLQICREKTSEQIIWGGNYFALPPTKGILVWDKLRGDTDFADGEMAWTNLNRALRIFRYRWNGFLVDPDSRDFREHPTQKPIALMKWCLAFMSVKTVLDPFCGSGTTLQAAKELGLKAIGIEIEEKYAEIAAKRLAQEVFTFEPVEDAK